MYCRGEVTSVEHVIKCDPNEPRLVFTKIQYSSGDIGFYQAIWNGPRPWIVTVTTHEKCFEMCPFEQAASQLYKSRNTEPTPVHALDTEFKACLRLQADEIVKALRVEQNNLPTWADGIATMKLVSQIYET